MSNPENIVLAHDSFTQLGGAERIVQGFVEAYPNAALYTTVSVPVIAEALTLKPIPEPTISRMYAAHPVFKHFVFFLPWVISQIRIPQGTRVLLSSSSLFLKAIPKPAGTKHVQYCHTPPRFLWTDEDYVNQEVSVYLRPFVRPMLKRLKAWDKRQSKNVDVFIANSREVQARIKRFYERDSIVLYPFVDLNFWKPTKSKADFFLLGGRLQAHKGFDAAVTIATQNNIPLKVIGTGRSEAALKQLAGPSVEFLGRVSDPELRDLYSQARGFIFPSVEDAGMMPLEAAACGTATLAVNLAGSLETVAAGVTGEHFVYGDIEDFKQKWLGWNEAAYQQSALLGHAQKFSKELFLSSLKQIVEKAI